MMEYKGYVAAVEFDDSIDVLHGRVVNSGPYPIATFEAIDATESCEENSSGRWTNTSNGVRRMGSSPNVRFRGN